MSTAVRSGIFISYRRQASSHLAGRIYDQLSARFGRNNVFLDVDDIELGVDFAEVIARAVGTCDVLLAIIGPDWTTVLDDRGHRRLDDPADIVRLEIEAALHRNIRVIPILTEEATMPLRRDLPDSLAALARRNALAVRHSSFRHDVDRLVNAIESMPVPGPSESAFKSRGDAPAPLRQVWAADIAKIRKTAWTLTEIRGGRKSRKDFRLESDGHRHSVAIFMGWSERIEVDGAVIARNYRDGDAYPAHALSAELGYPVSVTVERAAWSTLNLQVKSVTVTMGGQILHFSYAHS